MNLEDEIEILKEKGWIKDTSGFNLTNIEKCVQNCKSPNIEDIFNAFKLFNADKTRVLIIGKDPYPDEKYPGKADGLAFSQNGKKPAVDSLLNIFNAIKEYNQDFNIDKADTNLKNWAVSNKILLLNTALTYESENCPHFKYWKDFIDIIIKNLLKRKSRLVILAWGSEARDCIFRNTKLIKNKGKRKKDTEINIGNNIKMLYCYHPSPRNKENNPKIDTNLLFSKIAPKHFKFCNEFFENNGEAGIKWKEI